jgi:hypothetical protein
MRKVEMIGLDIRENSVLVDMGARENTFGNPR